MTIVVLYLWQPLSVVYSCPAVVRDIREKGRDLDQVLDQYTNLVKPAFEEFTLPVR